MAKDAWILGAHVRAVGMLLGLPDPDPSLLYFH